MKKSLIIPALAAMLAVSCNKGGTPGKKDDTIKFNFDDAIDFYTEVGQIPGVTLPDYVSANKEATMEYVLDHVEEEGILEARVHGSNTAEMQAYAQTCIEGGWALTKDDYGDYEGYFGNSLAILTIADWTLEAYPSESNVYDCIRIFFEFELPPSAEWPADEIENLFDYYGASYYEVPAFVAENATFATEVYSESGIYADGVMVTIEGTNEAEETTYMNTTLPEAGWEVLGGSTYSNGQATKAFTELGGVATVAWLEYNGAYIVVMFFELGAIPSAGFPSEAIAAAFEALEVPAFEIPAPASEGHTYEYKFDESNINYKDYPTYCYDTMWINNMSEEQFNAYRTLLEGEGWETEQTAAPYDYFKHFENSFFTAHIKLSWTSDASFGEYAGLRIYYIVTEDEGIYDEFPLTEILDFYTKCGIDMSTSIPAYTAASEDAKFELDLLSGEENDVYVYNTTRLEAEAWKDSLLTDYGWTLDKEYEGDYYLSKGNATISLVDYSWYQDGCWLIEFKSLAEPEPEEKKMLVSTIVADLSEAFGLTFEDVTESKSNTGLIAYSSDTTHTSMMEVLTALVENVPEYLVCTVEPEESTDAGDDPMAHAVYTTPDFDLESEKGIQVAIEVYDDGGTGEFYYVISVSTWNRAITDVTGDMSAYQFEDWSMDQDGSFMAYEFEAQGESLLAVVEAYLEYIPEYLVCTVEACETVDDYGDPMGLATFVSANYDDELKVGVMVSIQIFPGEAEGSYYGLLAVSTY